MAQKQHIAPVKALTRLLSREKIEGLARTRGVVRRKRKVDIVALIRGLVVGFGLGGARTLESLRQSYERIAGHGLARSAFYERLTPGLAEMLRRLALDVVEELGAKARKPGGYLSSFRELLAVDSTVLRLHELLAGKYPGCRTNHTKSAAKMHAVINVLDASPKKLKLTSERTGDTTPWKRVGRWLEGCLMLLDLGYYSFQLFSRIDRNGGYFISRLKTNSNPMIESANRNWRGRSIEVEGKYLHDILSKIKRKALDVEVMLSFKRRTYNKKRSLAHQYFRLVAVKDSKTLEYHCYLTNIPVEMLSAEEIARTYALRWQIEIFFKAMKSYCNLDHLPSRKQPIVECLVWSSILAVLASQTLYRLVRAATPSDRHIPLLRWTALFARHAPAFLPLLRRYHRDEDVLLGQLLARAAPDPNRNRPNRAISTELQGLTA